LEQHWKLTMLIAGMVDNEVHTSNRRCGGHVSQQSEARPSPIVLDPDIHELQAPGVDLLHKVFPVGKGTVVRVNVPVVRDVVALGTKNVTTSAPAIAREEAASGAT
jgi:hypothetical protein